MFFLSYYFMRLYQLFNSSEAGRSKMYCKEHHTPKFWFKMWSIKFYWFQLFFLLLFTAQYAEWHSPYIQIHIQRKTHKIYNDKTEPELINYIRLVLNIWFCQFNSDCGLQTLLFSLRCLFLDRNYIGVHMEKLTTNNFRNLFGPLLVLF